VRGQGTATAVRTTARSAASMARAQTQRTAHDRTASDRTSSDRTSLAGAGEPQLPPALPLPAWLPQVAAACCPLLLPGQLPRPPSSGAAGSTPTAASGRAPPFSAGT